MEVTGMKSYYDIFNKQFKKCKSKKEYRKLCKSMLQQLSVIDDFDAKQVELFSSLIGEETYFNIIALAIKMCILDKQGISYGVEFIPNSLKDMDT